MKRKKFGRIVLFGLCACALTGCGTSKSSMPQTQIQSGDTGSSAETSGDNSGSDLMESATIIGNVLDFSDNSCSVSQAKQLEGGEGMIIAADGQENQDNTVTVNYNTGCEFLIATITSGAITSVTNGSVSDVKKQSQVFIYGDFVDTYHLNADKIIVAHYE